MPLLLPGLDPAKHQGLGYAFASGLMFAASVYNLILPGLNLDVDGWTFVALLPILAGLLVGAGFLALTNHLLHQRQHKADAENKLRGQDNQSPADSHAAWGGRTGLLVFIAMTIHSIPEGIAVGTGFVADAAYPDAVPLGVSLAAAIAIHNIPEGLAVAIPLRSAGVSIPRCALAAIITSLPQPLAAVPAVMLAWFVQPLIPALMGFAAGAMIFLIVLELLPEALKSLSPTTLAWAFTLGFALMMLIQVAL